MGHGLVNISRRANSVGKLMYLTLCPHSRGSISGRGGVFQGIFPWLITNTWRGDGSH